MPVTDVDICNFGLVGILGASEIMSLSQPKKANEVRCARFYPQVRDAELRKHRWVCAKSWQLMAAPDPSKTHPKRKYAYALPVDPFCIRVIREQQTDWLVEGRHLYSDQTAGFHVPFIGRVAPHLFDATLVDVIAARLAFLLCEAVTQSNTKKADAATAYREAVTAARRSNAFEVGPEFPPRAGWEVAYLNG